ncbi:MAG: inositol monophosphatase family protein [Alphaproteobacteria bacterium]|nr:inositol monophosphatase family protein [Alphaproteobacteria bacterium]
MAYISPLLTSVVEAVKKSSSSLDRDFAELEKLQNSVKSIKTFVFNSYTRLEQNLKVELSKIRSDIPVLTTSDKLIGKSYFAVSPIEGLINFAHGNSDFAISVALVENDEIICGVIYNPARDETFFAQSGNGVFKEGYRNHERLRVSSVKELDSALVVATSNFDKDANALSKIYHSVLVKTGNLRVSGSVALDLAYLASGKYDALISLNNHFCSIAAGLLMIKEAGGSIRCPGQADIRVEDLLEVRKTGHLIATNFNLNQKIFDIFK